VFPSHSLGLNPRENATSFLGDLPVPTINLCMDASNSGLAVLHQEQDEIIELWFDMEKLGIIKDSVAIRFSINVLEHFSIALAA
jgi:hypothetical protein